MMTLLFLAVVLLSGLVGGGLLPDVAPVRMLLCLTAVGVVVLFLAAESFEDPSTLVVIQMGAVVLWMDGIIVLPWPAVFIPIWLWIGAGLTRLIIAVALLHGPDWSASPDWTDEDAEQDMQHAGEET